MDIKEAEEVAYILKKIREADNVLDDVRTLLKEQRYQELGQLTVRLSENIKILYTQQLDRYPSKK